MKRAMPITRQETADLLEFLETGKLGPIRPGMTQDEVKAVLGPPSDVSNPKAIHPPFEIYFYGNWLELTFDDGVLVYLSLRYKWQATGYGRLQHLRLPGIFDAAWAKRVGSWNYARFQVVLFQQGYSFRLTEAYDSSLAVEVGNGGILTFDHRGRYALYSIGFNVQPTKFLNSELRSPLNLLGYKRKSKSRRP